MSRAPDPEAVHVGIGGWTYAPWRGSFYPPGLPHAQELHYASRHVTAIEINGTFYRHQTPDSFASWRETAPDGFVFAVKAHRATTHGKDLAAAGPAVERFVGSGLAELGPKLGPILWQLPHTKKFDPTTMDAFLSLLPNRIDGVGLRHAVEARHASFLDPAWPALAAKHNVAVAIIESDKHELRGDVTADFIYARLQHNRADAPEGYDAAALDGWVARVRAWSHGKLVADLPQSVAGKPGRRECFVFFISGDKERAPDSARALLGRIR